MIQIIILIGDHSEIPEETVWTCGQGHLLCGECVDLEVLEVLEQNLLEDRKLGSESGIEEDMRLEEERESERSERSESCTISDVGSYVRYSDWVTTETQSDNLLLSDLPSIRLISSRILSISGRTPSHRTRTTMLWRMMTKPMIYHQTLPIAAVMSPRKETGCTTSIWRKSALPRTHRLL